MIVNIGKRIKVESSTRHHFECDCQTPGLVTCTDSAGGVVHLPGNNCE